MRPVRHYHSEGLLPEASATGLGYQRNDATVVEPIRIRTLADAGCHCRECTDLLDADHDEFADAIEGGDGGRLVALSMDPLAMASTSTQPDGSSRPARGTNRLTFWWVSMSHAADSLALAWRQHEIR